MIFTLVIGAGSNKNAIWMFTGLQYKSSHVTNNNYKEEDITRSENVCTCWLKCTQRNFAPSNLFNPAHNDLVVFMKSEK